MKSRFSEDQILGILREGEKRERSIQEVCRSHGISEVTYYRWRRRFQQMEVPQIRRLRQLEKENTRLKHLLATRDLEVDALKELLQRK
jgi:putative transposase